MGNRVGMAVLSSEPSRDGPRNRHQQRPREECTDGGKDDGHGGMPHHPSKGNAACEDERQERFDEDGRGRSSSMPSVKEGNEGDPGKRAERRGGDTQPDEKSTHPRTQKIHVRRLFKRHPLRGEDPRPLDSGKRVI